MSGTEADPMLLAAEYALGSLDLARMREAESLAARNPAFAEEIAYWERRLSPLSELVEPRAPPAELWQRLALAIGMPARPAPRRVSFWPLATGASAALAFAMALLAFLPRPPPPSPETARYVAALAPLASPATFVALSRPDGSMVVTSTAAPQPGPGRSYELWALPAGAAAPMPLGVLSPGGAVIHPSERSSAQEQLLISDEPAGGSPTGLPTGAVLFGGKLVPVSPAAEPGR